ncbi:MAG: excinuclease ABC subunit UvrC [Rickettsiaceae bacterium]|nr:excinuclease ABC subunit UvrC [Rickettsiaceae bacterium]
MIGADLLKEFCANLPEKPGIYKMIGENDEILYIGKAKNLKKRVIYYTKPADLPNRLARMVFLVRKTDYIITNTEAEAFLLEASQIKIHMPRFNILLKDDKTFPFIKINFSHQFPQIIKYRGKKNNGEKYFGPFASVPDVDRTINVIKKIFKIRGCSDSYFQNRTRPCLQYQIKRCSAPCAGKISEEDYKSSIEDTVKFLKGQSASLQKSLSEKMNQYSENLEFEKAAEIRDSLKALSYIQVHSSEHDDIEDADVIAVISENDIYCIQVFFFRATQNFGSNIYFPRHAEGASPEEVFSGFVGQFYQSKAPAKKIISNVDIESKESVEEALYKLHSIKTKFAKTKTDSMRKMLDHAIINAKESLRREITSRSKNNETLSKVAEIFDLEEIPTRIEVYDNSHIMGKFAVGAMIVAGLDGFMKNEYRKYTIETNLSLSGGDDYGMMREVLTRRIKRFEKEPEKIPSLIILDGGKAHLNVALKLFEELGVNVPLVSMSKGEKRNAGFETFHMKDRQPFTLDNNLSEMKYLQILRDEVHNYAITSHRRKRTKAIYQSQVDDIPGIGATRKKSLLNYFGSYDAIKTASEKDLQKAGGISLKIAQKIRAYFHPGE